MTFNKKVGDSYDFNKPLIEDNITYKLSNLESKYFEFAKIIDSIKEYQRKLQKMSVQDFKIHKKEM